MLQLLCLVDFITDRKPSVLHLLDWEIIPQQTYPAARAFIESGFEPAIITWLIVEIVTKP